MPVVALLKYRQRIDTECTNTDARVLDLKAIKLDGDNSLKEALGLAGIKTCDYLRRKGGRAVLIECTDLVRQRTNEQPGYQQISEWLESITVQSHKKSLRRTIKLLEPEARIREELSVASRMII